MKRVNLSAVIRYIRRAAGSAGPQGLTDAQLLTRFRSQRDGEAFAALVFRHGPLVRSVCRRILRHDQDAEDAFQAVFLVLASKAHSIRKAVTLASWLHRVAYRVAMNAKRTRRMTSEDSSAAVAHPQDEPATAAVLREAQVIVDEELNRLPEKYRAPFVLCCLDGKSRAEAAAELGLKEGTVSSRLARARQELQQRLTRRGVVLSVALCVLDLTRTAAPAIGPALAGRTAHAAVCFAAGLAEASELASGPAVALAKGVLFAMSTTSKLKIAAALVLTIGFITATGALARQVLAPAAGGGQQGKGKEARPAPEPRAGDKPAEAPAAAKADGPDAGEDFIARILKVSKGTLILTPLRKAGSSDYPRLPLAADAKILEGKRNGEDIDAGPAIPGGLENERLKLALPGGVARIITDATGKSIKEIRIIIPDKLPDRDPLPLVAPTGPRGEVDPDPLPAHAVARFGSLRNRRKSYGEVSRGITVSPDGVASIMVSPYGGAAPLIAVSPDGQMLASARSNSAQIWHTETGRKLFEWPLENKRPAGSRVLGGFGFNGEQPLVFSPDGKNLAIYCDASTLRILAVESGKIVMEIKLGDPPAGAAAVRMQQAQNSRQGWTPYLAYLPDGKQIILEDANGPGVRLFNLESGTEVRAFRGKGENLAGVALSPDGLALAMGEKDGTVKVWDVGTGKERLKMDLGKNRLWSMAFSPDGKTLAIGEAGVSLWDAADGKKLQTLALPPPAVQANERSFAPDGKQLLSFAPDGNQLAASNGGWVVLWDPATGKEIRRIEAGGNMSARFLPDSRTLFMAGGNEFHLLDAATGLPLHNYEGHKSFIASIAYSPDGKQIATRTFEDILVWDVPSRQIVLKTEGSKFGWGSNPAFSPNGNALAAARGETVFVWDAKTGAQRLMIPGQEQLKATNAVMAISRDGAKLAFGTPVGWVTSYDFPTGKELDFLHPGDGSVSGIAFSPDLRLVSGITHQRINAVSAPPPVTIRIWDLQTGKEWKSIAGSSWLGTLTFSPDGRSLLAAPRRGQGSPFGARLGQAAGRNPIDRVHCGSFLARRPSRGSCRIGGDAASATGTNQRSKPGIPHSHRRPGDWAIVGAVDRPPGPDQCPGLFP